MCDELVAVSQLIEDEAWNDREVAIRIMSDAKTFDSFLKAEKMLKVHSKGLLKLIFLSCFLGMIEDEKQITDIGDVILNQ